MEPRLCYDGGNVWLVIRCTGWWVRKVTRVTWFTGPWGHGSEATNEAKGSYIVTTYLWLLIRSGSLATSRFSSGFSSGFHQVFIRFSSGFHQVFIRFHRVVSGFIGFRGAYCSVKWNHRFRSISTGNRWVGDVTAPVFTLSTNSTSSVELTTTCNIYLTQVIWFNSYLPFFNQLLNFGNVAAIGGVSRFRVSLWRHYSDVNHSNTLKWNWNNW